MNIDSRFDFSLYLQIVNVSTETPEQADAAPTFRVYEGQTGYVGSGTCTQAESGVVETATNANPSEVTSTAHDLQTGTVVTISGVGGATGINGTRKITRTGANTFTVAVAAGGDYTSGGAWVVTGLYAAEFDSTLRGLLEPGRPYRVVFDYAVGGVSKTKELDFVAA